MISTRVHSTIGGNRNTVQEPLQSSSKRFPEPLRRTARSTSNLKSGAPTSKVLKPKLKTKNIKNDSRSSSLRSRVTARQANRLTAAQKDELPTVGDFSDGNTFFPSVIFGEQEKVGLSKIGRADKKIKMWEQILVEHKRAQPSLVSVVEEKLRDAKDRRSAIDENLEENHRVGYVYVRPLLIVLAKTSTEILTLRQRQSKPDLRLFNGHSIRPSSSLKLPTSDV